MRLHLPSRLRKAVLACLASLLSVVNTSAWSASLLPVGALCLFAAAPNARSADQVTIKEGDYTVLPGMIGEEWWNNDSNVIFDAGGTADSEKTITLLLQTNFTPRSITVASGTHVILRSYAGQTYNFTTSIDNILHVFGTLEYVATANYSAPGLGFGAGTEGQLSAIETVDGATGRDYSKEELDKPATSRIILNFKGVESTMNGLSVNRLFMSDVTTGTRPYNYSGKLELQGACFCFTEEEPGTSRASGGEIIVDGGAQLQLGTINRVADGAVPDALPSSSMDISPFTYVGDVTLNGSTSGLTFEAGTPAWVLKCGALRMVKGSVLDGDLNLTDDANVVVFTPSYTPTGGALQDLDRFTATAEITGKINGAKCNLTLTGAGTLQVGGGEVGQIILEDVANSGVNLTQNANNQNKYINRASIARIGHLEITSRASEENALIVNGYVTNWHSINLLYPSVRGEGWTTIQGSETYVFQGVFGTGNLHVVVDGDPTLVQRIAGRSHGEHLRVDTLRIKQGTVDLNVNNTGSGTVGYRGSADSIGNLVMSDRLETGEKAVSELLVNAGITLFITDSLAMPGGRIVVKGQANGSNPLSTYQARLVLGYGYSNAEANGTLSHIPTTMTECAAVGEMNGVIELDEYGVLDVYRDPSAGNGSDNCPTNGWNISVVHDTAIARSRRSDGTADDFVLYEKDRLDLNGTEANFAVQMVDGGVLKNAVNFRSHITIKYNGGTAEDEDGRERPVTFQMGNFGLNGSLALGNLVQGKNYGVLKDLHSLKISNQVVLDFSGMEDMSTDSDALFNFTGSEGELSFYTDAQGNVGTLTLSGLENGEHYHLSNRKIIGWRQKIGMSYYDAILRGVGFSFDEFAEEGYGDGWLTVTSETTPSNIYMSTRDNGADNKWGWNPDGNPYESTSGARAVCVDEETRIDLSATPERGETFKRGLILPNLVGKSGGNLVITGNGSADPDKRSLVTFSNRIDDKERAMVEEQTGVIVKPDLYYDGSINVTASDLAIRHVQKVEDPTDLAPPQHESATIVTGSLNLSEGTLWMQSGALVIQGGHAELSKGSTEGGILFAGERTAQMRISEGGRVTVDGRIGIHKNDEVDDVYWWKDIPIGEKDQYKEGVDPHILMSGASVLNLKGASLEGNVRIGRRSDEQQGEGKSRTQVAGTVNIDGTVKASEGAQLTYVALRLQEDSRLVEDDDQGRAAEWRLSGLSGSGKLELKRELTFDLAGGDHTFTGDLVNYHGKMILRESGEYTQIFNDVNGNAGWDVEVQNGARVKFNISDKSYESNKLQMGEVTLQEGSRSSFLLNLASENLKPGGNGTAEEGFFFEKLSVSAKGTVNLEVGQESGAVVLANEDNKVKQYIGHATSYSDWGGKDGNELSSLDGVTLKNVLNVKAGTGRITIDDASGDIYIEGELDAENKYLAETDSVNSRAGANFFNSIYSSSSALLLDGDLGYVVQALNDMLKVNEAEPTGKDTAGSNKLLASLAGSSTSVLAPALGADMQRNLRSIRNRTTSMGMDDGYEYENLSHTSFWVNAETSYLTRDDDGLLSGYKSNAYGGTLGVAHNISTRSTIGLALSAMYQNVTSDNADHMDADFTTAYLNLFAVTQRRSWRHTFIASVGLTNAKMDRRVSWTNGNEMGSYSTSGSTNGTSFGAMYELGYAFAMNEDQTTVLQPVFNLQWHNASLSEYDEEGGSTAALRVDPGSYSVVEIGLGTRLQMMVGESVYNRASLLEMRALLKFYAGDSKGESSVALLSNAGGSKSTVEGASEGRVGIEVGAGLGIPLGNNAEFFFDAGAEVRSSFFDFNATAGLKFNF